MGVGDDAAVLHYSDKETLVSSQMFMEGVQFDLTYIDMEHLAYKVAMIAMSNIFAMNGQPRQLIVSLGLGKRFKVEDLDQFYAAKDDIVYRSGANETDLICVTGDLGSAYMGLQILEREKTVYYQQVQEYNNKVKEAQSNKDEKRLEALRQERAAIEDFQPDFAGKEYLIDRQLKPEARGAVLSQLRTAGIHPTSMIDISDGLASELKHICEKSHCGCRIYEKNIPIDYQTAATCEEFNMNLTTAALNGGEDYELLFTVPIGDHEKIDKMENIRQIGYITKESLGTFLIARDGNEFELKAQGWPKNEK